MVPRNSITINNRRFQCKKAAEEHFRSMLARIPDNARVNGDDEADLMSLLMRHPEAEAKIGVGVKDFYTGKAIMGTRCFHLRRHDGTTTDFSFRTCVSGRSPSPTQEFLQAARMAVQPQIDRAKKKYFDENMGADGMVACDLTGQPLQLEDAHADHAEPMTFEVIVATFLASKGIDRPEEYVTVPGDMQYVATFKDQGMAGDFRAYHRRVARVRWISKKVNLSIGAKHRLRNRRSTVVL